MAPEEEAPREGKAVGAAGACLDVLVAAGGGLLRGTKRTAPEDAREKARRLGENTLALGPEGATALQYEELTAQDVLRAGFSNTTTDTDTREFYGLREQPANEQTRISVLSALDLLDSEQNDRFDAITRLTQEIFGTAYVLISLVDTDRQWFLSNQGLKTADGPVPQTPRNVSFCAWTLLPVEPRTLVVRDTLKDPRFAQNSLVTGFPHIRFYMGAPLELDGDAIPEIREAWPRDGGGGSVRIGTLCVIDTEPREVSKESLRVLERLARLVVAEVKTCVRERKQRAALDAALEAARAGEQAKERFLATVSHELRTPLNAVVNASELLVEARNAEARDRSRAAAPATGAGRVEEDELLAILQRSSQHMVGLVNQVLDYSRLAADKLEMNLDVMDVRAFAKAATDLAGMARSMHSVRMCHSVASAVPAKLLCDWQCMQQLVSNLVGNAVKFTPDGGAVSLSIDLAPANWTDLMRAAGRTPPPLNEAIPISLQRARKGVRPVHLLVTVTDSGVGVDAKNKAKIFGAFTQEDGNATRNFGGSGLGLTICERLVALLNGGMWMTSEGKGKGSTFTFVVRAFDAADIDDAKNAAPKLGGLQPRTGVEAESASDDGPAKGANAAASRVSNAAAGSIAQRAQGAAMDVDEGSESFEDLRILVVDDNSTNRLVLAKQLKALQIDSEHLMYADTGVSALKKVVECGKKQPHMILMDLHMPEMDGCTATAAINGGAAGMGRYLEDTRNANAKECLKSYAHLADDARDAAVTSDMGVPQVIAVTADSSELSRAQVLAAGFAERIVKPVTKQTLRDMVHRVATHG